MRGRMFSLVFFFMFGLVGWVGISMWSLGFCVQLIFLFLCLSGTSSSTHR